MWFKNVMIYRLTSELTLDEQTLNERLTENRFTPCEVHDMSKFGWFLYCYLVRLANISSPLFGWI